MTHAANHRLPTPRRIYQKHISKETSVASGGANPIPNNDVGSTCKFFLHTSYTYFI